MAAAAAEDADGRRARAGPERRVVREDVGRVRERHGDGHGGGRRRAVAADGHPIRSDVGVELKGVRWS
eukprot:1495-Pelagococcus_subviridis.AAC.1